MGMLGEATDISMAKIIEPRMSLAFKKELVKIIISTPIPSRKKCRKYQFRFRTLRLDYL
jgi:hypothetical protein